MPSAAGSIGDQKTVGNGQRNGNGSISRGAVSKAESSRLSASCVHRHGNESVSRGAAEHAVTDL